MPAGDSIILEEEVDPSYEPTQDEVLEYARWLGMDTDADSDLLYIAREGLKAPLPENWKPCKTADTEEIYYFNFVTGESTWDHPCDQVRASQGATAGIRLSTSSEQVRRSSCVVGRWVCRRSSSPSPCSDTMISLYCFCAVAS